MPLSMQNIYKTMRNCKVVNKILPYNYEFDPHKHTLLTYIYQVSDVTQVNCLRHSLGIIKDLFNFSFFYFFKRLHIVIMLR